MSNKNKNKVISIIAGTAIFFTTTGMNISHAGIVADNSRYQNTSAYSSGYSLNRTTSSSSVNKSTTVKSPTSTINQTTQSTSPSNTTQTSLKSSSNYYYVSPYSSNSVRSNSYSISNSTTIKKDSQGSTSTENNNVNQDSSDNGTTYTQDNSSNNTSNNIIVDNSYSTSGNNSVSLSQAAKSPTTEELPKLSSDELLESLPEHEMTYEKEKLLELINGDRVAAGLQPLKIDDELCQLAQIKSQDMYDYSYFSHVSPNFGKTSSLIRKKGISYYTYGENIGRTQSVYSAHNGFMNSDGHRANIMNPKFTHIGIGIVENYYTEVFISK